jgi:hypothetical protein
LSQSEIGLSSGLPNGMGDHVSWKPVTTTEDHVQIWSYCQIPHFEHCSVKATVPFKQFEPPPLD